MSSQARRLKMVTAAGLLVPLLILIGLGIEGRGPFTTSAAHRLRRLKDRSASPDSVDDMTFDEFVRLPPHPRSEVRESLESHGVRLEGYVAHIRHATDGDFHLDVTLAPPASGKSAQPFLAAEVNPAWQHMVPGWTYDSLRRAFRSSESGQAAEPVRVRLTGWLLYDMYADLLPRAVDPHGVGRVTAWEIHPVTHIEVWDESQKRMVDLGGR